MIRKDLSPLTMTAPPTSVTRSPGRHLPLLLLALVLACLAPLVHAAKLDTQGKALISKDKQLYAPKQPLKPSSVTVTDTAAAKATPADFNLYRSELKRVSYETIYRILRDKNEPPPHGRQQVDSADEELRFYQPQQRLQQQQHQLVRRSVNAGSGHALDLSHRNLSSINASTLLAATTTTNLTPIEEIDLSDNQLQHISLVEWLPPHVQLLNLANNKLEHLPTGAANTTLRRLNVNGNRIVQIAAAPPNAHLQELHLSGNGISDLAALNLTALTALETLDLSCNRIERLDITHFPPTWRSLQHLNLAHNRITSVARETFYNLINLNTLLLRGNRIADLDYETFLALPKLQYLDLSHNQLKAEAIRALQGIPDLEGLSIAHNPQVGASMQEFVASWSLKELDASGTGLCQIPAALAQSVRTLKLTANSIKAISCGDLDSYPLLQHLDLSHSHIEEIEDDALGRLEILEVLFLDHNRLHRVPLSLPTSLEHLFLQHNQIMDIQPQAFQLLRNLQTLDLSGNAMLLYLPALPLPKLLTLNLQASGVRSVNPAIVNTLPRLRDLMLEDNPIRCSELLSVAEWAGPCRILDRARGPPATAEPTSSPDAGRLQATEAGESIESEQSVESSDSAERPADWAMRKIDLKQKFVKMHNFYANFASVCSERRPAAPPGTPVCPAEVATNIVPDSPSPSQAAAPAQFKSPLATAVAAMEAEAEVTDMSAAESAPTSSSTSPQAAVPTAATAPATAPTAPATAAQIHRGSSSTTSGGVLATATSTIASTSPSSGNEQQSSGSVGEREVTEPATATPTSPAAQGTQLPKNEQANEQATLPAMSAERAPDDIESISKRARSDRFYVASGPLEPHESSLSTQTAATTTTTTTTPAAPHKHEPLQLQLHVKDRHLIGTPLLMHKGEHVLVEAEQLLLPPGHTATAAAPTMSSEAALTRPQVTAAAAATAAATTQPPKKRELKKKPSLTMKKMTITTKHAAHPPPKVAKVLQGEVTGHHHAPSGHEELQRQRLRQHHQEPNSAYATQQRFDSLVRTHDAATPHDKPEHWLDLRRATTTAHPGLVILLSFSLFVLLLVGLMHVYRCELPWRHHLPARQRPHQRHFNDDDVHSFLSYQCSPVAGDQQHKWPASRLKPHLSSPLHSLHVHELQRTSAIDPKAQSGHMPLAMQLSQSGLGRSPSLGTASSEGSHSSSHCSPQHSLAGSGDGSSASGIANVTADDSFYIEMTPDAGQPPATLHSDLLPMELLSNANNGALNAAALPTNRSSLAPDQRTDGLAICHRTAPAPAPARAHTIAPTTDSDHFDDNMPASSSKLAPATRTFHLW